jgi:alkanesulfonate monooxygenase SsuD/methylene tetrahydromethanopterin reductase-like flavin-dependent oxidoreductase (luciferase family)
MHVGVAPIFQNPLNQQDDGAVYAAELRLAELAEPLGFDSLWSVEHHFTDYTMVPDVLQLLSYWAGRTRRIQLGSMVVVLPWHDPVRVAEQVSLLDHVSGGRLLLGIGRGAGRVEFEGFRVSMSESRERFIESAQALLPALESGTMEYEGKYVRQPRVAIRPRPARSFRGRTYAAAVSPESAVIMAQLGVGILIIPQKPWEIVSQELATYRRTYQELHGAQPPSVIAAAWTFVDEDEGRARAMAERWIGGYWQTAMRHYEIGGEHWNQVKGYDFYRGMSNVLRSDPRSTSFVMDLQVWGTPKQCRDKILQIRDVVGASSFVGVFSYAGMPPEDAESNMRLFAAEVMPELKRA